MKKLLKQFRAKAVLWVFNRYFGDLIFGFETADKKLEKLNETQRVLYYEGIEQWVDSTAYNLEEPSKIEDCYRKLASEAVGEDIITAYRLALLLMKNQDIRLRMKIQEYQKFKALRKTFTNINN